MAGSRKQSQPATPKTRLRKSTPTNRAVDGAERRELEEQRRHDQEEGADVGEDQDAAIGEEFAQRPLGSLFPSPACRAGLFPSPACGGGEGGGSFFFPPPLGEGW